MQEFQKPASQISTAEFPQFQSPALIAQLKQTSSMTLREICSIPRNRHPAGYHSSWNHLMRVVTPVSLDRHSSKPNTFVFLLGPCKQCELPPIRQRAGAQLPLDHDPKEKGFCRSRRDGASPRSQHLALYRGQQRKKISLSDL